MTDNNNNFPHSNGSSESGSYGGEYQGDFGRRNSHQETDQEEIDLKRLFFQLWHNKVIIISSVLICMILAGIVSYSMTPIYQSEGSMLISQQQNRYSYAGSDIANLLTSTYGIGVGSTIANELQILRSRKLSLMMADTLLEKRFMRNSRQFPLTFKSYPDDSSLAVKDTVALRIRNTLSFTQVDQEADLVTVSFESPSPEEAAFLVNLSMEVYTGLSTSENRRSANSAVEFLSSERDRIGRRLARVEDSLRVFMNKHKLIQVDAQTQEVIKQMADLESVKQEAKAKLVASKSAIAQYRAQLNSIEPGLAEQYSDAIGPNMTRFQYAMAELELEKTQLIANNPSLRNDPNPPERLKKIESKIAEYKKKIKNLTQSLIDEGEQYLGFLGGSDGNIAQAVSELNKKLIELKVQKKQARAQISIIDKQLKSRRNFFDNLPDNMITLARLKRNVKINEQLYLTVSQQYSEMTLWKQTQFGKGRPVDKGTVPIYPVKPNKTLFLLVGFILGGILSVGYIFVGEAFNTKIDGVEKLKSYGVPLLSVVPDMTKFIKKEQNNKAKTNVQGASISTTLVTMLDTISPISESFRRLESNIIYSNPDRKLRSLMITSSSKGEGKTTVVSNLGIVLAEAGYNVIIVDTDLRRPNVHNQFGLNRSPGIVESLFESISLDEAIQPTVIPKLSVLSAGSRPPNPSAITQSRVFLETIKKLESKFDYVLIDTPPYGIITDASAMINQTDGVIVVSRFNETTEMQLDHVFSSLNRVKANIIGTVLSAFDHSKTSDYYYSTYYYRDVYEDYESYHS